MSLAVRLAVDDLQRRQLVAIVFNELLERFDGLARALFRQLIESRIDQFVFAYGIDGLFVPSLYIKNLLSQLRIIERSASLVRQLFRGLSDLFRRRCFRLECFLCSLLVRIGINGTKQAMHKCVKRFATGRSFYLAALRDCQSTSKPRKPCCK